MHKIFCRAITLQNRQALGLITDRILSNKFNQSEFNISMDVLTLVENNAKKRIEQFKQDYPGGNVHVYDYGADDRSFDASQVVILLMAVLTVIIGSLWSGYTKHSLRFADCCRVQPLDETGGQDEDLSFIFIVCRRSLALVLRYYFRSSLALFLRYYFSASLALVFHYYFYNQLVYVIMGMYCIESFEAMCSCLEPMVASCSPACLPVLRLRICNSRCRCRCNNCILRKVIFCLIL